MKSIFLSYTHKDKKFVKNLAEKLKSSGLDVWVDEGEMKIGDSLLDKIPEAIEKADYVGVVLSPNSVSSNWVKKELEVAISKEIESGKKIVLPILIKKCSIPAFLKPKIYADFTNPKYYKESLKKLLDSMAAEEVGTTAIFLGDRIGIVHSSDGKLYKIQLSIVFNSRDKRVLNGAELELDKKYRFELKQFFQFDRPINAFVPNAAKKPPVIIDVGSQQEEIEFQTINHSEFKLAKKNHFLILSLDLSGKKIRKKIKFKLDDYHKKGFDIQTGLAAGIKRALISYLPIDSVES